MASSFTKRIQELEITQRTGVADKHFRCGAYGPLGLMESLLKYVGMAVAFASISGFTTNTVTYSSLRVAQMWVLGIVMALHALLFVQRLAERELQAIVFGFTNVLAHIALFVMLFRSIDPSSFLVTFCFLFIMGDFIKILFLFVADDFSVLWLKKPLLYVLTLFFIAAYFTLNILQLVLWYEEP